MTNVCNLILTAFVNIHSSSFNIQVFKSICGKWSIWPTPQNATGWAMNLPWQYTCQKGKTRFYRGLVLIITDVGTECIAQAETTTNLFSKAFWLLPEWWLENLTIYWLFNGSLKDLPTGQRSQTKAACRWLFGVTETNIIWNEPPSNHIETRLFASIEMTKRFKIFFRNLSFLAAQNSE